MGSARPSQRAAAVARGVLLPVVGHDASEGTALESTLRAWIANNCAWEPTAQQLGIHRHTLRNRIDLAAHYGLYRPGQQFTDALAGGGRGPLMVVVPHGGFRMGAAPGEDGAGDAERPQHYVRFDRGFAMGRTDVTVGQFRRFIEATGHETRAQRRGFSTVYDERRCA